ncbi:MAG: response regulator transcription factor [Syntrophobacterales bacterium]
MDIRIIIADDHQIVRQGLKVLIEKEPDMQVVGEAEDGQSTVNLTKKLRPHVVLMDIKMPDLNGIEATRQILSELPDVKIIALSMYPDQRFVMNMLKSGARGYLLKDSAFEELAQAIRLVMANKTYLCPLVTEVVVKDLVTLNPASNQTALAVLTSREREVLRLLAEGKRTSQIAQLLDISVKTVDTHRQQIIHKLGIRSLAELTKYAIREGLTSLEL